MHMKQIKEIKMALIMNKKIKMITRKIYIKKICIEGNMSVFAMRTTAKVERQESSFLGFRRENHIVQFSTQFTFSPP